MVEVWSKKLNVSFDNVGKIILSSHQNDLLAVGPFQLFWFMFKEVTYTDDVSLLAVILA